MAAPVRIEGERGPIEARWDAASGAPPRAALLTVGGGDGGFEGPAEALYPTLADDLGQRGIGTLRLDFRIHRFPNDVAEGVHDVLAGVDWLVAQGVEAVALLGHSFGGAVVIEAGARRQAVTGVVTLATQTAGIASADRLAPRPLLLIHGVDDTRLPSSCSEWVYARAGDPKALMLISGATHSLRQARETVRTRVLDFLVDTLPG